MDTVPETFVDAFGEISLKHGMIRIELVSLSGSEPRVTQRLITSLQAFSQMLQTQNGMREQLEKAGMMRSQQPSPGAEPGSEPTSPPPAGEETVEAGATVVRLMPQPALPAAATPAATARRRPKSPNFSDEQ
ncbi:MAG: hypothetical protein E5X68_31865 [Mesorhizobium sp.]|uniref:hypothetical protein n=2 Tax=Mesorhizobium sp. TaxID=1871066 RepID=UPI000FE2BC81|nr:hypothetical protein [Mesorhizobium sp.]RWH69294.1 MAG: hypothetical protein EOQ84_21925 [Mesorhizobium sp.]RWL27782.1 MAG: hypothetical protein EOR58_14000 [Mesorhizobium sp.]RWL29090.1 MAG: hypothetical protein EOR63_19115 [Mesorhizobium sp.]RWL34790.1 MAG: hypothetical protein EOR59_23720 [Mesorhizobium sp.]RWL58405.1 MAG: hypothetical protein EOR62_03155 [Mesorhizobium sp.]